MADYIFGANILENLTTGMYQDSRVIYREYIQNACDQIDIAYKIGLLPDKRAGRIDITIDVEQRIITIEDNATGIARDRFQETLANIADSDKHIGEAKGFRGIGRLCGLAYCSKLIFSAKYQGEDTISIMSCDAKKMRNLISQNSHGIKHTASEVLHQIYNFSSLPCDDINAHWFRVELINVNSENHDLLDFQNIKDYLSFVAPVPYQNKFIFRNKVYEHSQSLSLQIDEYTVAINGEQIFKKYGTHFKTSKGEDEIADIVFKDFFDINGTLIAWMWIGISNFKAIIEKSCPMRGIRLRKENIQIGNEDALQKLFREDRGNHYFIGEVFAISPELIPNSQRDYFNENSSRVQFETYIRNYFDELYRLYHDCSKVNSAYSRIDAAKVKEAEHQRKIQNGDYVDEDQRRREDQALSILRQEAEDADRQLEKMRTKARGSIISQIIQRNDNERAQEEKRNSDSLVTSEPANENKSSKHSYRTDKLSQYNKRERKLISLIFAVILKATDEKTAETIISKIEDALQ